MAVRRLAPPELQPKEFSFTALKRISLVLAKVIGLLAIMLCLFVVSVAAVFLAMYLFVDGSGPEDQGTDLGAGFALGLALFAICLPASVYGGIVLGMRFLFGMRFGEMFAAPNRAEV
jgi:hypothetical protein